MVTWKCVFCGIAKVSVSEGCDVAMCSEMGGRDALPWAGAGVRRKV